MLYAVPVPLNRGASKGTAYSSRGLVSRKSLKQLQLSCSMYATAKQPPVCSLTRSSPVLSSTSSSHQLVLLGFGANPAYIPEINCIAQDLLVFFPTAPCTQPVHLLPLLAMSYPAPGPLASSQLARFAVFSRSSGIV